LPYQVYKGNENAALVVDVIDDIEIMTISLEDLKINKKATGRYKDLDDLENLNSI